VNKIRRGGYIGLEFGQIFRCFGSNVTMDFIRKEEYKYYLTPESELFLVSDKPTCLAGFVKLHKEGIYGFWSHLGEAVKSGISKRNSEPEEKERFYSRLVRGLFILNYPFG
jgi:hypothetical protein